MIKIPAPPEGARSESARDARRDRRKVPGFGQGLRCFLSLRFFRRNGFCGSSDAEGVWAQVCWALRLPGLVFGLGAHPVNFSTLRNPKEPRTS